MTDIAGTVPVIAVDKVQAVALAVCTYYFGVWLKGKVGVLSRYSIPSPVVGGMSFAIVVSFLEYFNIVKVQIDSTLQTVLMLGDDVVNKTVPLILCAEENVVGNHGATIGELDDETLFYFESRGISRAQAENILARASIERFARTVDDEALRAQILQTLEEELNDDV